MPLSIPTAKSAVALKRARYSGPILWTVLFFMAVSVLFFYDIPLARNKGAHPHYLSIRWMLIPHRRRHSSLAQRADPILVALASTISASASCSRASLRFFCLHGCFFRLSDAAASAALRTQDGRQPIQPQFWFSRLGCLLRLVTGISFSIGSGWCARTPLLSRLF